MKSPPGAASGRRQSGPAAARRAGTRPGFGSESSCRPRLADVGGAEPEAVSPDPGDLDPEPLKQRELASTSRIRGTRCSSNSSSVSRQAARIGSAAFLLPATVSSPESGTPPWMTNFSIALGKGNDRPGGRPENPQIRSHLQTPQRRRAASRGRFVSDTRPSAGRDAQRGSSARPRNRALEFAARSRSNSPTGPVGHTPLRSSGLRFGDARALPSGSH